MPSKKAVVQKPPEPFSFGFKFKLQKRDTLKSIKMKNTDDRNAFYNIELVEDNPNKNTVGNYKVTVTFGKIGTAGRTITIAKGTEAVCTATMVNRHAQKLAKGYKTI